MRNSMDTRSRRLFLGTLSTAFFTTRGLFAEQLLRTPELTEGPFYPDKLPLDTDNDLIIMKDHAHPGGRRDHPPDRPDPGATGTPVRNATIEIWQCDANAVYLHSADNGLTARSRTGTSRGSAGSRPGRPESIASGRSSRWPIRAGPPPTFSQGEAEGTASCSRRRSCIAGHPGNARDGVFMRPAT